MKEQVWYNPLYDLIFITQIRFESDEEGVDQVKMQLMVVNAWTDFYCVYLGEL